MELPEGVFTNSHKNRSAQPKNNAEPVPSESSEKQSEKPLKEEKKKQNQKEKTEEKKQEKKEENRNKEKEKKKEKKEKKKIQLPGFSFAGKIKETAKKATEKKQKEDKAGTEFPIAEEKQEEKAPEKSGDTILSWLVSIILCNIPAVDIIYFIVCAAKPVKSRKNWALASLIIACIRIAIIIGTVAFILSRSEKDLYNFFYSLSGSL